MSKNHARPGRTAARLAAVQALYQMEIAGAGSKIVVDEFASRFRGDKGQAADTNYFEMIVLGAAAEQEVIDPALAAHLSPSWPLARLDMTMRAILRCGGYEIIHCTDVPAPVIISEYVGIAADFFGGKEPAFINGALDGLARDRRGAEFKPAGLAPPIDSDGLIRPDE